MKTRVRRGIMLTMAYLAIALIMTEPLIFHFSDFTMGGLDDGSMSVWNLWWMKYSIMDLGQSPLFTDYLFYPDGVSLALHSIPKVQGLIGIPLIYLMGITASYNILQLLTFVLTALATYWLLYHFLGERLPAFLAGVIFAYSPVRWGHLGHSQLLSTMLIPVYILFLIKGRESLEGGRRKPWIWFTLAGLVLAVTAYDTEYYAVFLLIFSALYFCFYIPLSWKAVLFRKWGMLLAGMMITGTVFLVLFSPMLLAVKREISVSGDYFTFPAVLTNIYSADLLSFIIPRTNLQFFGSFFNYTGNDDNTFLGWLPMLLSVVGIVAYRRSKVIWLWVLTALMFGLLALGPHIKLMRVDTRLPGPYLLLTKIPLVNSVRVPARFTVIVMLAIAVLAAFGCSALFGYIRRREWERTVLPVAVALILLGTYIEFNTINDFTSSDSPPIYQEIAASDLPGSVVTLPLGWEAGNDITGMEITFTELFQLVHQRPMLGGMVARARKDLVVRGIYTPVVDFLADPVQLSPSDLDRDPVAIARFKEKYEVAFIVAHKVTPEIFFEGGLVKGPSELTSDALKKVDIYVTGYLDMEKFAETDEIVAWRRR